MAIKVKNKSTSTAPEVEVLDDDAPVGSGAGIAQSGFTLNQGSWLEENPQLALGAVVGLIVLLMGGYFGLQYQEDQKVSESATLTPAFTTYNQLVKGSEAVTQIEANENIEVPKDLLENEGARWKSMYESSSASLSGNGGADVARSARLVKAASALRLEKNDEAITLYQEALKAAGGDKLEKAAIYHGLATAQAAKGDFDGALKSLDELAALDESFAKPLRYERGQILEAAGKVAEAKKLYHEILEDEIASPNQSDIERRLATL